MADMHIVAGKRKGTWQVVMHFDIPDVNNAVGVNVRTAMRNSGVNERLARDGTVIYSALPPGDGSDGTVSPAEVTELTNGEKFEHIANVFLDGPGADATSRLALLRDRYSALNLQIIRWLTGRLNFFGLNVART